MAQQRRKAQQIKRRQQLLTVLCVAGGLGAALLSLVICLLVFDLSPESAPVSAPVATSLPYNTAQPFSISDLTMSQQMQIREKGRISLSDGPRGISIGDTLEEILDRFPSNYLGDQPEDSEILYCAEYFANQNSVMTVLPPRGLLTTDNGEIVVTLLSPTSAYPAGTKDNYGSYEHIYCVFTIEPESMTVSSIVLGIDK